MIFNKAMKVKYMNK